MNLSQPVLPMRPGQIERRTHDYVRQGTTSLFAALNVKTGKIIAQHHRRHRSIEFRKFLVRSIPRSPQLSTSISSWTTTRLTELTPAGASWINQVERFFADLTSKQLRRGAHRSTAELEHAIRQYIDA